MSEIRSQFSAAPYFPQCNDQLGWLSLLQHYGCPTRLLDWTEDPRIAAFFSIKDCDVQHKPAVWVLKQSKDVKTIDNPSECFQERVIAKCNCGLVRFPPGDGHERVKAQKGLFLAPTHLGYNFNANFAGHPIGDWESIDHLFRIELDFDDAERHRALSFLDLFWHKSRKAIPERGIFS